MALDSDALLAQIRSSLGSAAFATPGLVSSVETIINSFTIGQYRDIIAQVRAQILATDFSFLQAVLDGPSGASIPAAVRSQLEDLISGDKSLILDGFDLVLDALDEVPANTPLLTAIDGIGGGAFSGFDEIIDQATAFVGGSKFADNFVFNALVDRAVTKNGDDSITGSDLADDINSGRGNDSVDAGSGDDKVAGKGGDDTIAGGDGADTLKAGRGADEVEGGDKNDFIKGGGGDDLLEGGSGDDTIKAGRGDDTITGGAGDDLISAGGGRDTLIYNSGDGSDTVLRFEQGLDLVDVSSLAAGFEDLSVQDVEGGAEVSVGDVTILFVGQSAANFSGDDFIFGSIV